MIRSFISCVIHGSEALPLISLVGTHSFTNFSKVEVNDNHSSSTVLPLQSKRKASWKFLMRDLSFSQLASLKKMYLLTHYISNRYVSIVFVHFLCTQKGSIYLLVRMSICPFSRPLILVHANDTQLLGGSQRNFMGTFNIKIRLAYHWHVMVRWIFKVMALWQILY